MERYLAIGVGVSAGLIVLGLLWFIISLLRFVFSPNRRLNFFKTPLFLLFFGGGILGCCLLVNWYTTQYNPIHQEHAGVKSLTLTDVKEYDYSQLSSMTDLNILQMANADVTDETLGHLKPLVRLERLDLSKTGISDEGLAVLKEFPNLKDLYLINTKITDDGFKKQIMELPSLMNIDVSGTSIKGSTLRTWKKAKEGRKYLGG